MVSNRDIILDGLVYDGIGELFPSQAKDCVKWLRLQPRKLFSLQPYERLAKVLKTRGDERAATDVLIAKQVDLRTHGRLTRLGKLWNWLLGFTIRYGYRPHRALIALAFFVTLGTILFDVGYHNRLITPIDKVPITAASRASYPRFEPFIYFLECFVPFLDLKQRAYWLPNANTGPIALPGTNLRWGGVLRIYYWVHLVLGWIVNTLWIAGFTGIVRRLN
jgi:hypothetical protein